MAISPIPGLGDALYIVVETLQVSTAAGLIVVLPLVLIDNFKLCTWIYELARQVFALISHSGAISD